MKSCEFLSFLAARLHLSDGQQQALMQHCMTRSRRIGKVLLESRLMSMKQVTKVLEEQEKNPTQRFGDIAVELGFVRRPDLERALVAAREHPAEIVWKLKLVPDAVLLESLIEYVASLEKDC